MDGQGRFPMNGLRGGGAFALAVALVLGVPMARAQDQPPKQETPPPAAQPADPKAEQPASPKQPTLDDLLGIPKDKSKAKPGAKPRPAASDPTKAELDRKLSAREVAEQFKQAVDLMGETAERIQVSRDTGLTTQRLQEDILRKLDQMIKAAEQNQKQSRQQSSPQRDQSQQQANQSSQQRNPEGHQPAPDTMQPPAGAPANPNPGVAARGAAWGNLPERMRDALVQGNTETYSRIYKAWTEAYYRRLAEEANR